MPVRKPISAPFSTPAFLKHQRNGYLTWLEFIDRPSCHLAAMRLAKLWNYFTLLEVLHRKSRSSKGCSQLLYVLQYPRNPVLRLQDVSFCNTAPNCPRSLVWIMKLAAFLASLGVFRISRRSILASLVVPLFQTSLLRSLNLGHAKRTCRTV